MRHKWVPLYTSFGLAVTASCSVRVVYNDQERALAQKGVEQFHGYYNRKDYEALYSLMSEDARRAQPKEVVLPAMQATVDKWGREESTSTVFTKVFPNPIQVRMIYNTTYEKGKAQEWFIWTTD